MTSDPTDLVESEGAPAVSAGYTIMSKYPLVLPEGANASINSMSALLVWRTQGTDGGGGGTGNTKWMFSPTAASEVVGSAPSGSAVDITDELAVTTSLATHRRSGQIPTAAIPATNAGYLLLVGVVNDTSDSIAADTFNESEVVVEYEV